MEENPSINKRTRVDDSQEVRAKESHRTLPPRPPAPCVTLEYCSPAPAGGLPTDSNYSRWSDFPKDTTQECEGQLAGRSAVDAAKRLSVGVNSCACFYIKEVMCAFECLSMRHVNVHSWIESQTQTDLSAALWPCPSSEGDFIVAFHT